MHTSADDERHCHVYVRLRAAVAHAAMCVHHRHLDIAHHDLTRDRLGSGSERIAVLLSDMLAAMTELCKACSSVSAVDTHCTCARESLCWCPSSSASGDTQRSPADRRQRAYEVGTQPHVQLCRRRRVQKLFASVTVFEQNRGEL